MRPLEEVQRLKEGGAALRHDENSEYAIRVDPCNGCRRNPAQMHRLPAAHGADHAMRRHFWRRWNLTAHCVITTQCERPCEGSHWSFAKIPVASYIYVARRARGRAAVRARGGDVSQLVCVPVRPEGIKHAHAPHEVFGPHVMNRSPGRRPRGYPVVKGSTVGVPAVSGVRV